MSITKFADGAASVRNSSHADALADLLATWPDMVTHSDGERTLVWVDEESSINDDGANAVAEIRIASE